MNENVKLLVEDRCGNVVRDAVGTNVAASPAEQAQALRDSARGTQPHPQGPKVVLDSQSLKFRPKTNQS